MQQSLVLGAEVAAGARRVHAVPLPLPLAAPRRAVQCDFSEHRLLPKHPSRAGGAGYEDAV